MLIEDDLVAEGTITEEQWKKIRKWFFARESVLLHLIEESGKERE